MRESPQRVIDSETWPVGRSRADGSITAAGHGYACVRRSPFSQSLGGRWSRFADCCRMAPSSTARRALPRLVDSSKRRRSLPAVGGHRSSPALQKSPLRASADRTERAGSQISCSRPPTWWLFRCPTLLLMVRCNRIFCKTREIKAARRRVAKYFANRKSTNVYRKRTFAYRIIFPIWEARLSGRR